jgi:hypothetical protein
MSLKGMERGVIAKPMSLPKAFNMASSSWEVDRLTIVFWLCTVPSCIHSSEDSHVNLFISFSLASHPSLEALRAVHASILI